jgi:arabinoxylan arabinofuranohydrolase
MKSAWMALALGAAMSVASPSWAADAKPAAPGSNPLFRDRFTADPAPLVVGDRLFLYVGHDEAQRDEMFNMREWLVYSTTDMKTWTSYPPIMKATDFKWAKKDAWASQAIQKNGKFYFYAAVEHDGSHPGKAIGVAVSDSRPGPSPTRADPP